jgi:hypothetical protein
LKCAALIAVLACFSADCIQVWGKSKEPKKKTGTTEARKSEQQRLLEVRTSERVSAGKLPLQFEENKGQADPGVQFISRGAGYTLFLTANEAVFVLTHQKPATTGPVQRSPYSQRADKRALKFSSVLRMKLSGSNAFPQAKGTTRLPGTVNYFIGRDATQWRTGIPT